MVCVGSSTCFQLFMYLIHIRPLEFKKPAPLVKKEGFRCGLVRTLFQGKGREGGKRTKPQRSTTLHIKGFCADFVYIFYTLNCPHGAMFFPNKLSSTKVIQKSISGTEKAKTFASLSQPTSVYCRNSTGISDTKRRVAV